MKRFQHGAAGAFVGVFLLAFRGAAAGDCTDVPECHYVQILKDDNGYPLEDDYGYNSYEWTPLVNAVNCVCDNCELQGFTRDNPDCICEGDDCLCDSCLAGRLCNKGLEDRVGGDDSSATATSNGVCDSAYHDGLLGSLHENVAGYVRGTQTVPFQGTGCPPEFETADCTCPAGQGV